MSSQKIFITGGTGYIGKRLIRQLLMKGYEVYALVREKSADEIPGGCHIIIGNALDADSFKHAIPEGCQFVHLVGVAHPGPSKKEEFIRIDLASIKASIQAAAGKNIGQFIYMSVAASSIMKDYSAVRMEGEQLVRRTFANATFIRPFYVLGPGHYWPLLLQPLFFLLSLSKSGKEKAGRLGLVWIGQMINTLLHVVSDPSKGIRIIDVREIKKFPGKYT